jgi:hypothetical protein
MKLFGMVLLAGFISLICGVAVTSAASSIMPCYSDKAGCGMGEAYRLLFVPGYVLLAMIGFGIAAPGKHRERALKLAMLVFGTGGGVCDRARDGVGCKFGTVAKCGRPHRCSTDVGLVLGRRHRAMANAAALPAFARGRTGSNILNRRRRGNACLS